MRWSVRGVDVGKGDGERWEQQTAQLQCFCMQNRQRDDNEQKRLPRRVQGFACRRKIGSKASDKKKRGAVQCRTRAPIQRTGEEEEEQVVGEGGIQNGALKQRSISSHRLKTSCCFSEQPIIHPNFAGLFCHLRE